MIKIKFRELFCIPKPLTKAYWNSKLFLTWGARKAPNLVGHMVPAGTKRKEFQKLGMFHVMSLLAFRQHQREDMFYTIIWHDKWTLLKKSFFVLPVEIYLICWYRMGDIHWTYKDIIMACMAFSFVLVLFFSCLCSLLIFQFWQQLIVLVSYSSSRFYDLVTLF